MLNGILTRWEMLRDDNFQDFLKELQEYLKSKLNYTPLEDGSDYWMIDFDYKRYMEGYLPDADPFKHTRNFCENRYYDWWEIREMINEYKGDWVLDDAEILNRVLLK